MYILRPLTDLNIHIHGQTDPSQMTKCDCFQKWVVWSEPRGRALGPFSRRTPSTGRASPASEPWTTPRGMDTSRWAGLWILTCMMKLYRMILSLKKLNPQDSDLLALRGLSDYQNLQWRPLNFMQLKIDYQYRKSLILGCHSWHHPRPRPWRSSSCRPLPWSLQIQDQEGALRCRRRWGLVLSKFLG